MMGSMASSSSPMGTAAQHMAGPATEAPITVTKAEGGKTVAEIWQNRGALKDGPIVVRGKVVKALNGIMGRNWIHLRDGSGERASGTDDLTVTTNETATVGEVITVKGTLRVDKDFGAGYRYTVILEDGKITK